jgi:peptide/nickel transport system substrate-binding protein
VSAASFIPVNAFGQQTRGGTLVIAEFPEPTLLTSALIAAAATNNISPKMFDGLVTYDLDTLEPKPQLAESWEISPDGLTLTFKLRDGVKWHDGQPFSSADVAFTIQEILLKYNSRGKAIYGNVTDVETPDALTVVLRLSKPAPYIMAGLSGWITQILPKHVYEGTEALTNPANTKPSGATIFAWNAIPTTGISPSPISTRSSTASCRMRRRALRHWNRKTFSSWPNPRCRAAISYA